jgi:hypothetical protein
MPTVVLANAIWHHDSVTLEEAMTELLDALADTSPDADEKRSLRIAAAFYEAAQADRKRGWQKRLAERTGVTRETIRRHVEDERIRRGEIEPTSRYLADQERRTRRRASSS